MGLGRKTGVSSTESKAFLLHLSQDKEPRGIIPLENLSIREVEDSKKPVSVLLLCPEWGNSWDYDLENLRLKAVTFTTSTISSDCPYFASLSASVPHADFEPRSRNCLTAVSTHSLVPVL